MEWWAVTVSNRRPSQCKRDALPTEPTAPDVARGDNGERHRRKAPALRIVDACRPICAHGQANEDRRGVKYRRATSAGRYDRISWTA